MNFFYNIAGAMEDYGESAVSHIVTRFGSQYEIATSFNIEAGIKLQRLMRYKTVDGRTFMKKEISFSGQPES
jgi:hypothetical protein